MRRRHHLRHLHTAIIAVLSLVFAQLAWAGYVCPVEAPPAVMADMPAATPCNGMDIAQPALCHQHAADAALMLDAVHAPALPLPAAVLFLVRPPVADVAVALPSPRGFDPEARPPPDPIFLSTLRLRV